MSNMRAITSINANARLCKKKLSVVCLSTAGQILGSGLLAFLPRFSCCCC